MSSLQGAIAGQRSLGAVVKKGQQYSPFSSSDEHSANQPTTQPGISEASG